MDLPPYKAQAKILEQDWPPKLSHTILTGLRCLNNTGRKGLRREMKGDVIVPSL